MTNDRRTSVPTANQGAAKPAALVVLLIAAYAAVIYLPFLGSSRILTRHEVMVTHPALRMLDDGAWIVPHYSSGRWLDKPPLVNWLTAACFAAYGGFNELPARLPSALSAIALCVLVFVLTDRFYSRRAAVFAGLMQATCVYMYMQGRLGEIDMVFALFLAGSHAVLVWYWGQGRIKLPVGAAMLFHASAGLAMLSKGALGVVLIGFTVFAFCIIKRSWKPFRAVVFTPGIIAFLLVTVPWHVAAYMVAGEEALEQWSYNSVLRFVGLHHLAPNWSPFYYFYWAPILVLPWSIALFVGAKTLWREARKSDANIEHVLWAWFLGGLAFLTISIFKHKHYSIPILPPLTILAAHLLDLHYAQISVHRRRFIVGVFVALPIIFGVVGGVIMPARDHRRATADFVRTETSKISEDQKLYVIGLGQSAAYPYIQHKNCVYLDSPEGVLETLDERDNRPMWVIAPHQHLSMAGKLGLDFQETASEPVRDKHPEEETLVLGRLSRARPTSAPASAPTTQP